MADTSRVLMGLPTSAEDGRTDAEKLRELYQLLYTLRDDLRYILNHIGDENITDAALTRISETARRAAAKDARDIAAEEGSSAVRYIRQGRPDNEMAQARSNIGAVSSAEAAVIAQEAAEAETEDTVRYTAQTLTEAQKAQVRENIGAAKISVSGARIIIE